MRPTVICVMSTMRSGSTWLNLVLGSHSWAASLGEYFRPFLVPGHVACRLCEADGLPACTMLDGIEAVPAEQAYAFAAERMARDVVIDASKHLVWYRRFIDRQDLDLRLVHLVRHPCGFVESEMRRNAGATPDTLLAEWVRVNGEIEEFIATSGRPAMLTCYEGLADDPARYFPPLCAFAGGAWEPDAMRYWEVPHHGLGGNGAASLYLRGRGVVRYVTGDDAYYRNLEAQPTAADARWKSRLPEEFRRRAVASPYAQACMERLGDARWEAPMIH